MPLVMRDRTDKLMRAPVHQTGIEHRRPVQIPLRIDGLCRIGERERSSAMVMGGVLPDSQGSRVRCADRADLHELGERNLPQLTSDLPEPRPSLEQDTKSKARCGTSTFARRPQSCGGHVSDSRINPGSDRLANACNNDTLTTTSLSFDNSLNWCHCANCKGGLEATMSSSTPAKRCDGRRPRAGTLRGLISPSNFTFAKMLAPHQFFLLDSQALVRRAAVSNKSTSEVVGDVSSLNHRAFLFNKVLRFWQKGQRSSPRLVRISSGLLVGSSLAAKGDALIHGPTLVARPVGSEWRNHHLHLVIVQSNQSIK